MRDEDMDEIEEEKLYRANRRLIRFVMGDPFYPPNYHADDMRADIVDISESEGESE